MITKRKARVHYAPIPRMRPGPTTAKAVLEWVYDRIKEEPRRLNMTDWVVFMRGTAQTNVSRLARLVLPECGTVACMGGWINLAVRNEVWGFGGLAARQALRLPIGVPMYDRDYEPQFDTPEARHLSSDLDALFAQIRVPKSRVLKNLKAIITQHAATLAAIEITVPTAKAVQEQRVKQRTS